jgi:hypothetical protein
VSDVEEEVSVTTSPHEETTLVVVEERTVAENLTTDSDPGKK